MVRAKILSENRVLGQFQVTYHSTSILGYLFSAKIQTLNPKGCETYLVFSMAIVASYLLWRRFKAAQKIQAPVT